MSDVYSHQLCLVYMRELLKQYQQGPVAVDQRPSGKKSKTIIFTKKTTEVKRREKEINC